MLYINPKILIEQINDNFYIIINLQSSNKIKIINKAQFQLIEEIKESKNKLRIKDKSHEYLAFIDQLKELDLVNSTGVFNHILSRRTIKSINFWVHTTDKCNLNCSYCYIRTKKQKTSIDQETRIQLAKKIIETVSLNKIENITLRLAGGEPLIVFNDWKDFIFDLKKELLKLKCTLKPIFLTNLTLFPNDFVSFIKLTDAKVSVSLDGLEKFHDKTRKFNTNKGSFTTVKRNLINLIESNITPSIMTVLSNENLDGIFDFCKWVVDQRLPFRFSIVHDNPFNYHKALNVLLECYNYIEIQIKNDYPFARLHRLGDLKFGYFSNKNCGCGLTSGTIYSDGNIYYCQKLLGSGEFSDNIFSKNDLLLKIGDHELNDELIDECDNCKYRYICNGGCPLSRVNGKTAACGLYKEIIPIIYRLIGLEKLQIVLNNIQSK